jgi:hypothetical protein
VERYQLNLILALGLVVLIAANAQAGITISSTVFEGFADDMDSMNGGATVDAFVGTTIPTSTTVNAIDGQAHSKNVIDWSLNGGQTILKFDVDHKRSGTRSSQAITYGGLTFTANANEPYELSGYYNSICAGGSAFMLLEVSLGDITASTNMFRSDQASRSTTNEQFVLGGTGGDESNVLSGNIAGYLISGHEYQLDYTLGMTASPNADPGATALGNLTLTIGTVPEPSSLLLCLAGVVATIGGRKRRFS